MWVNVGVEVVVMRRLCWGAAVRGASIFVADPPCGAACAVLLRAGCSRPWGRVGVPPILGHTGGGVHFPGLFWTRPWRVFGVRVGWLWADLSDLWAGALVQTNSVRDGLP